MVMPVMGEATTDSTASRRVADIGCIIDWMHEARNNLNDMKFELLEIVCNGQT